MCGGLMPKYHLDRLIKKFMWNLRHRGKMRILIYSTPGQAENVFPLVKALQQEKADVTYLLSENRLKSTIFDVKTQVKKGGIIPATDFPELKEFKDYMNMDLLIIEII